MERNSKTSPVGGNRGCLCDDSTYSKECCEGRLINQGIGSLSGGQSSTVTNTNQVRTRTRNQQGNQQGNQHGN